MKKAMFIIVIIIVATIFICCERKGIQQRQTEKQEVVSTETSKETMRRYFPLSVGNTWTYIRTVKNSDDIWHTCIQSGNGSWS